MKLLKLSILALLCFSQCIKANGDNTIIEAIKESDPEALRYLLIPGFYIQNEEKKRYLSLAKGITNKTYVELHKSSWSDLKRGARSIAKLLGAAGCSYIGWHFFRGKWNLISFPTPPGSGSPAVQPLATPATDDSTLGNVSGNIMNATSERLVVYTFFGTLISYLFYKGGEEFTSILSKQDRLEHHRNALAVEAIINRLPLCAEPTCNMTHPEGAVK